MFDHVGRGRPEFTLAVEFSSDDRQYCATFTNICNKHELIEKN
jgi:hypothetical protein